MARKATIRSIIGVNTIFEGVLTTTETTRVDGEIHGTIRAEGLIIIGEEGKIEGDIYVHDIVVAGTINGNIFAKGKTEVADTGRIYGDLKTRSLTIDENAVFQGQCAMNVQSKEDSDHLLDDDSDE